MHVFGLTEKVRTLYKMKERDQHFQQSIGHLKLGYFGVSPPWEGQHS